MHEVVVVGDLASLPLEGNVFQLIYSEAVDWHSLSQNAVDPITICFCLEGEVVAFIVCCYLETDLHSY